MYKVKAKHSVGPLKDLENKITDNNSDMCNILNLQFLSVFTNENINQIPDVNQVFNGSDEDLLNSIQVSCDEVTKEIDRSEPSKSPGPDEVFAGVLNECKEELYKSTINSAGTCRCFTSQDVSPRLYWTFHRRCLLLDI